MKRKTLRFETQLETRMETPVNMKRKTQKTQFENAFSSKRKDLGFQNASFENAQNVVPKRIAEQKSLTLVSVLMPGF